MYKEYKDRLDEVAKYIHHLEETILNYESKLQDMELDDIIEPNFEHQTEEEWANSKTHGNSADARREALAKCAKRSELELKRLDSLE